MAKAGNEARIEWILKRLRKGLVRSNFLQEFTKTYSVSEKTFDTLLKTAKERYTAEIQAAEAERQANLSESLKSEIQAQIVTDIEIDLILSKLVTGQIEIQSYMNGEKIIREVTPMEIIAAADKLYKRKGSYAPTKLANTDTDGKDVPRSTINLPNGAVIDLA